MGKTVQMYRQQWMKAEDALTRSEGEELREALAAYQGKVAKEISARCAELLDLLNKSLIPSAPSDAAKVFYLKQKSDYLRYAILSRNDDEDKKHEAFTAYKEA